MYWLSSRITQVCTLVLKEMSGIIFLNNGATNYWTGIANSHHGSLRSQSHIFG